MQYIPMIFLGSLVALLVVSLIGALRAGYGPNVDQSKSQADHDLVRLMKRTTVEQIMIRR